MKTQVSVKTITEVKKNSGSFQISCFSDMNEDGTTTPVIYKSRILEEPMIIDTTSGIEGELMISHVGETVGNVTEEGDLIIEPDGESANKYDKEQENLVYDEG